ncbi:Arc family DNA-binding protein [Massilia sp. BHUDP2]|uniref:Arc family DNA-binding protein n=1 Tax=Massilia sp. BHUDP2 TaxID=3034505 RepID=UPI0039058406
MEDDNYTRITLRMPKPLHLKLQGAADATSKSMNAEIIARLEESFSGATSPQLVAAIARMSVALSLVGTEKVSEQMRTNILAQHIRFLCDALRPHVDPANSELSSQIDLAYREASSFLHSPRMLEEEMASKAQAMQQALTHIERLAGGEGVSPELKALLQAAQRPLAPKAP